MNKINLAGDVNEDENSLHPRRSSKFGTSHSLARVVFSDRRQVHGYTLVPVLHPGVTPVIRGPGVVQRKFFELGF